MKTNYKNFLLGISLLMCTSVAAQVSSYIFAQSNGTYMPITTGSVIATATANANPGNLAGLVWNLPNGTFPFPFVFNGVAYTGCNISCNGYITFGAVPPTNVTNPINNAAAYDGAVVAWGRSTYGAFNLTANSTFYTSELMVEVIGTAPSRTIVIQYDNWRYSGSTSTTSWLADYQIRLIETTNVIEIIYGPGVMAGGNLTTGGFNCQVGLRGATNTDFNNRSSFGPFDLSTAGTANNASQAIGVSNGISTSMPPDGLVYRWYPPCANASSLVTPSITVNSTVICTGDTLKFNATGETPYFDIAYQWQQSNNPTGPFTNVSGDGTNFATYETPASGGIVYYMLVTTCTSVPSFSVSNQIIVDVRPLPVLDIFSNPPINTTVTPIETCFGETYTLSALGAVSFTWVGGPTTDTYVVQPAGNPVYTLSGTSFDGCISTRTLDILVNPLPIISTIANPGTTCPGQPVVVAVTGNAATYQWISENSNSFLITVTPTTSTLYSVLGTALTGCTVMAGQQVLVHNVTPIVALSSVGSATICRGEEISLSANGANTYTWSTPTSFTMGAAISVIPDATTTYSVRGTDANGCVTQATVSQVVTSCIGLNELNGSLSGLTIYPNPNNGVFTVELNNSTEKTFELLDMTGRVILSETTSNGSVELNINDLANGFYYLRAQSNGSVSTTKILKQ